MIEIYDASFNNREENLNKQKYSLFKRILPHQSSKSLNCDDLQWPHKLYFPRLLNDIVIKQTIFFFFF